ALAFVAARAPGLAEGKHRGIVQAAMRVIGEPDLAPLFSEGARAEVSLSGTVRVDGAERSVFGRVDRLAVTDGTVWLADFKTGRPPAAGAALPKADAGQIALYAALLARIYPEHHIRPVLVWASGPVIRPLSEAEMASALAEAGLST
ncbi:PD-(D/E)XK nuclease family protein, partial [Methylobacterium trifolii]